ncbi:MAG: hypothetical protein RSB99_02200 [Bacilli bacterium]
MNNGLGINDVTIGYSALGAEQYIIELNARAISETKYILSDIDNIKAALERGWVGQAQINFVSNLQKSIVSVQGTLDELKNTLDAQFSQIEETWAEQDKNIIPLD